tara:strand:- start:192 stop:479 length:288 start_codon:yes stop_codon:yes gene_type:complete
MRLTENKLRLIIRRILKEQVLGYKPPHASSGADQDYIDDGSVSAPATSGSEDEDQAAADSVKSLTQQRQAALNKGNTVQANSLGRQLSAVRRTRG